MLYRTQNGIQRVENYTTRENYSDKQKELGLYIGVGIGAVILLIIIVLITNKKKRRRR